jgi:hypothetical protein
MVQITALFDASTVSTRNLGGHFKPTSELLTHLCKDMDWTDTSHAKWAGGAKSALFRKPVRRTWSYWTDCRETSPYKLHGKEATDKLEDCAAWSLFDREQSCISGFVATLLEVDDRVGEAGMNGSSESHARTFELLSCSQLLSLGRAAFPSNREPEVDTENRDHA